MKPMQSFALQLWHCGLQGEFKEANIPAPPAATFVAVHDSIIAVAGVAVRCRRMPDPETEQDRGRKCPPRCHPPP